MIILFCNQLKPKPQTVCQNNSSISESKQRTFSANRKRRRCFHFYERKARKHADVESLYLKFGLPINRKRSWDFHCVTHHNVHWFEQWSGLSFNYHHDGRNRTSCRFQQIKRFRQKLKLKSYFKKACRIFFCALFSLNQILHYLYSDKSGNEVLVEVVPS